MTELNIVFAYTLQEGQDHKVAIAIFPASRTTVQIGGAETWVHYTNGATWHNFQAETDTLRYLGGPEAVEYASRLRSGYIEEGTIAGSPVPRAKPATVPQTPLKFPRG